MIRIFAAAALVATTATVSVSVSQEVAPYLDDRSTAERVVSSLYNAIDRQEYLRAHSYFDPESAPDYDTFREGYATTQNVSLRLGKTSSDGAAGTIHFAVPVAIEAVTDEGTAVFTGCYYLSQVQPAVQEVPPFRPMGIDSGKLSKVDTPFETAMGECDI